MGTDPDGAAPSATPLFGSMPSLTVIFAGVAVTILIIMWFFAKKTEPEFDEENEDEDGNGFDLPRSSAQKITPEQQIVPETPRPDMPAYPSSTADMDPQELWQGFMDGERDAGIPRVSGPTNRPPPPSDEIDEDAIWNRQVARGQRMPGRSGISNQSLGLTSPVRRSDMGLPPSASSF